MSTATVAVVDCTVCVTCGGPIEPNDLRVTVTENVERPGRFGRLTVLASEVVAVRHVTSCTTRDLRRVEGGA